jgi:4-alpha-glucanotransferase
VNPRDLVGDRYVDALGSVRIVPDATREAFVAALASSTSENFVAATRVLREGQPLTIDVTLPAESWNENVLWTLAAGRGSLRAGTLRLQDAPVFKFAMKDATTFDSRRLAIPVTLPIGIYKLTLDVGGYGHASITVAVCPKQAYVGSEARVWGLAVQVYAVRSQRNWGIGDLTDLDRICALAADAGATYVGINPLHASHRSDPESASPYAPSSRRFLNWLAIDVEAVPEASSDSVREYVASLAGELAALRAQPLVDYTGVARLKAAALERCFARLTGWRAAAFRQFVEAGGEALRRFAVFEALVASFGRDIAQWPPELQQPNGPRVAAYANLRAHAVAFGMYLQWCASEQLAGVAERAAARGIHLYRDLAVGVESNSADAWGNDDYVRIATVGAPPDILNTQGQDWGLPPLSPTALARDAYGAFAALLADNMRSAGALRLDHAMSLMRLFWIPVGSEPADGAYVAYPFEDLLAILARESTRFRCTVIGEDLGTVPNGFRERMAEQRVYSYRLLLFERAPDGSFLPADQYPELALAATGTHDLPPLAGWLAGDDIALRQKIGLLDASAAQADRAIRAKDRSLLVDALRAAGDLEGTPANEAIVAAAYRFLARTPARIVMVQLDDVAGETAPVNVPGTDREHPNWRRKLRDDIEVIAADGRLARFAEIMRHERPREST